MESGDILGHEFMGEVVEVGSSVQKLPMGAVMNKALTLRSGQTHVHRYLTPLMQRIENGEIDPSFLVTHEVSLEDAPKMYRTFRDKEDGCIKAVMHPGQAPVTASAMPSASE